ncbi:exodeoxyribonuclease V subunit gamma [Granulicoccus phenolivorans]|uniref:exodeoxyribonuclease V subunit gamma n=1 Tax=Granulicoccus phenolivorans TaxID=266854 RepID=UPI0003FD92FE|nr:exodeoxyribonuclease V subunit gamma [Granulicoccus phenolivorans]
MNLALSSRSGSPAAALAAGVQLHLAPGLGPLGAGVADLLRTPLADPFAAEAIVVPGAGVERWLSQSLSLRLGISAGIDFLSPQRLRRDLVQQALDLDPVTDPWLPEAQVWGLLQVIAEVADEPWFRLIRDRVATGPRAHTYTAAVQLRDLYADYAAYRPAMLEQWRQGRWVDPDGTELGPDAAWQARLWSRLRARLGGPDPVERIGSAAAALREHPELSSLPPRVSVFGTPRLSPDLVPLLGALAEHRRVDLWLTHPSPVWWDRVRADAAGWSPGPRSEDPTSLTARHRLNRRLGRDAREQQVLLRQLVEVPGAPLPEPDAPGVGTLLGRLQAAIHADLEHPAAQPLDPQDRSVRFHASHGPDRQVEVLREVVLELLAEDPTLEPRDIVVLCPQLGSYLPLLQAAWHTDAGEVAQQHPAQAIRMRITDRSLRELNPLLATLTRLMDLNRSRARLSGLLDFCAEPAVARRFGFTEKRLERLQKLLSDAGLRWGIDADHRRNHAMGRFGQNTWRAGLDRLLLGVTMSEQGHHFQGLVLPYDDVASEDVQLIGNFAELVEHLTRIADLFGRAHSVTEWAEYCRDALSAVTEPAPADRWQKAHAWSVLADLADSAGADTADPVRLTPAELRSLLLDSVSGRSPRASFGTGALTVSSLHALRGVPHRVVCLLGPDAGVFPHHQPEQGDSLMRPDPWVGDPDAASADRQALLEAVLAAEQTLVVIHGAFDARTGRTRPPSAPIAELRAAVTDLCTEDPFPVIERRHPAQPFTMDNFRDGSGFDPLGYAIASTPRRSDEPEPRFTTAMRLPPLPEHSTDRVSITLQQLQQFYAHPIRTLLRKRAEIDPWRTEEPADEIPTELDGLQRWHIGNRMLRAHLAGADLTQLAAVELRRGELPPGQLGDRVLRDITDTVSRAKQSADRWAQVPADTRFVRAEIGNYVITGSVPDLRDRTILTVEFGRIKGGHLLRSWLNLLALTCHQPNSRQAVLIGARQPPLQLRRVEEAHARAVLSDLITLYLRGCTEPLPLPPKTGYDFARGNRESAVKTWKDECSGGWEHFYRPWLWSLEQQPCGPEDGPGTNRFQALNRRVWQPLLDQVEKPA